VFGLLIVDFEATIDHQRELVWISYAGTLTLGVALSLLRAARAKAAESGYPIVYDLRQANLLASLVGLSEYPSQFIEPEARASNYLPAVHLISPDDNPDYWQFYERQAQAAGLKLRLFYEEAEAITWLKLQTGSG
jgi:hypothetical protein